MTIPTDPPKTNPPKRPLKPLPIQSSSHIPQLNVNLLYQGAEKTGKSTNLLSWPNPFLMYYDKNLGVLREHPNVPFVTPTTWKEVEEDWIPAIQNRRLTEIVQAFVDDTGKHPYANYKVRTLGVDSFTNFLNMLYMELEQNAPVSPKSGEKDGFWIWREYFNRANRFLNICVESTIFHPKRPQLETYHFIGTIHEVDIYDEVTHRLIETKAAVQGKLQSQFKSYFDAVLLTECQDSLTMEPSDQPGVAPRSKRVKNYSVSAADVSAARRSTISGEFTKLPPKLKGDYATINSYLKLDNTGETK